MGKEGAGLELAADPTVDSATTVDTDDSVDRAAQGAEGRDLLQWSLVMHFVVLIGCWRSMRGEVLLHGLLSPETLRHCC